MIALRETTLDSVPVAESARVCGLSGAPAVQQRLSEMGLTRGETVRMVRTAPLGDPVQIEVRGYQLSLRRSEVQQVLIEPRFDKTQETTPESPAPRHKWLKRFGWAGFLFFAIKGLLWLTVPALLAFLAS